MTESRQPQENIWQRQQHAKLRLDLAKKIFPIVREENLNAYLRGEGSCFSKDQLVDETFDYVDRMIERVKADAGLESLF